MTIDEPYFMKRAEWFYFSHEEFRYKLTDKATSEAKKSYDEFYAIFDQLGGGSGERKSSRN